MKKFHVTYYYLATGMDGRADQRDYGTVEADTSDEAKEIAAIKEYPEDIMYGHNNSWSTREFFKGCLAATEVVDSQSTNPNYNPLLYG